ncbi:hypothetical protein CSAL01_04506 [Colletotrichum salicis]|uniref:Uncharacterized protein n=1 Tax=Colletotrichum salicis TaxID=1209931 RepID=A0A135RVD1_9PEZI|nr:hypothetical protein CSAL01_04506 [Colletotrichum salicis]
MMDVASKDATCQPPLASAATQLEYMPDVLVLNIVDMLLDDDDVAGYLERVEEGYDVCKECSPDCRRSRGVHNATDLARICMRFYNIVSPAVFKHDIRQHYASSLLLSAKKNNIEGVSASTRHGANINQTDRSLLHIHEEEIMEEHRFERSLFPVETSLTALHWASLYGYTDLVHHLLKTGADVQQRADLGFYHYFDRDPYVNSWQKFETDEDDPHRALFCATMAE